MQLGNTEYSDSLRTPLKTKAASVSLVALLLMCTLGFALYTSADLKARVAPDNVLSLANFKLVDHNGKRLKKSDLKDRLVMMNFFFTSCGSACPVQTAVLKKTQENIDPSIDVLFVSVSIAPMADTPEAIAQYLEKYYIRPDNWKFVTASVEDTAKLMQQFSVSFDDAVMIKEEIDHRNMGYLFGKSGMLMQQYQLVPGMSKRLVREVAELATLETLL